MAPSIPVRPLKEIAREIRENWKPRIAGAALPAVEAMSTLDTLDDFYGGDSAVEVVSRFLAHRQTWRGPVAERIKAELQAMLVLHSNRR
jgi:hypothetical protein